MKGSKLSVSSFGAIKPTSLLFCLTHCPIDVRLPPWFPLGLRTLDISEPKKESDLTLILLYFVSKTDASWLTIEVVFLIREMRVHNSSHVPKDAHHDDGQHGEHDDVKPIATQNKPVLLQKDPDMFLLAHSNINS